MREPRLHSRHWAWLWPIGLVAAVAAIALAIAEPALARAGGGQGYSGGGGGGGGGRSGGGGSGGGGGDAGALIWLLFQLIRLVIEVPYVGIPLVLLIIGFFVYSTYAGKNSYDSSIIRRGVAAEDRSRMPQYATAIRTNDPAFDTDRFLHRVRGAFVRIQHAWSNQNLSDVRAFISDAVYERFSLQFDEQRALGYRNEMKDVVVRRSHIANAQSGEVFDEVSVRIEASASDQNVDLQTGRPISGTRAAGEFVEVWSFLRRRGAKTKLAKPGLMEGNCPNCGGPIEMNQAANCTYCGALLRSGQYDWVLAEITQQYEWEPRKGHSIPGVSAIRERDKDFNPQELEDRASVIYWRWAAADRLASATPLAKVALPAFVAKYESQLRSPAADSAPLAPSPTHYFGECAVGAVDLLGVLPASGAADAQDTGQDASPHANQPPLDLALVNVRWQGHTFKRLPPGQKPRRGDKSAVTNTLFVLGRSPAARTNPDQSIASAHCPSCGAPEVGGSAANCGHCGTPLNLGTQQWALAEMVPLHSEHGQDLLRRLPGSQQDRSETPTGESWLGEFDNLTGSSAASTLRWMAYMTAADGNVSGEERDILRAAARRYGVPKIRLEEYISAAEAGSLDLTPPANEGEARRHLADMARTALADGKITPGEAKILHRAGKKLGLGEADIKLLLARTRGEMLKESRKVLRQAKSQWI
ncbi:TIM44-like domain-containing protein [Humisphaera borealis]|uniref:TIM44-like domain-containing protein n=1 Tax=Humisphaera borealis TaxID=2807512 RepID=A0A7M2WRL9_9BACT|nr:TIM44-like domain-containing protein [Humisphaera borealis]QOV88039.1 TIM44-like domain-containing protein [Humisphaera borealis]